MQRPSLVLGRCFAAGRSGPSLSLAETFRRLTAFSILPLWDYRGRPVLGTYGRGQLFLCEPNDSQWCVWNTWPELWFAYYRDQVGRVSWHGELLEDKKDHAGTFFRRNRYYDPVMGKFTQEDPIGLAGGLAMYGYAEGDPFNNDDPDGLYCVKKSEDHLECTDLGPGDFHTIRDFLGGEAGQSAYEQFERAGLTQWDARSCRGGFTHAQCDRIADALSSLTLHAQSICTRMGVSGTKRFQSGRYRWRGRFRHYGESNPFFPFGFLRRVWLGPLAFEPGELANTIAHEEFHHHRPFARHSRVHAVGDSCAGAI
jgi:RHS repeat-associated protein